MTTYSENLAIAVEINNQVRRPVVCTNDIIRHENLPFFFMEMQSEYEKKFGRRRVQLYLDYQQFIKDIRTPLLKSADENNMVSPGTSASLAVYELGVAECREFSAKIIFELSKNPHVNFAQVIASSSTLANRYFHSFVLIGSRFPQINGSFDQLDSLPDDVVIIDSTINYVGRANTYRRVQNSYLIAFGFDSIIEMNQIYAQGASVIRRVENNVRQLVVEAIQQRGIKPFDKNRLDLLTLNDRSCHETGLLGLLNKHTSLTFHGISDEEYKVDAVTEISNVSEERIAHSLQNKFKTGFFYEGRSSRFFVLPNINSDDCVGKNKTPLREKIHNAYFGL